MIRFLFPFLLLACFVQNSFAQAPVPRQWHWVTGGQSGTSYPVIHASVADTFRNVYITGYYRSNITFNNQSYTGRGSRNIFLAKIDSNGNALWFYNLPSHSLGEGTGVVLDKAGNAYMSFYFTDRIYPLNDTLHATSGLADIGVVKIKPNGQQQWIKTWGTFETESISNLAIDANDQIYFTGNYATGRSGYTINFNGHTLSNTDPYTQFLAKMDTSGTVLWAKNIAAPGYTHFNTIRANAQGELFITGAFPAPTVNFNGTQLTRKPNTAENMYLAKFDNSGNIQWARSAGSASRSGTNVLRGNDLCLDRSGNIYLVGDEANAYYFDSVVFDNGMFITVSSGFLAKYTASGQLIWVKKVGQDYPGSPVWTDTKPRHISMDRWQRIFISGYYHLSAVFGTDTLRATQSTYFDHFIACYDTAGNSSMGENLVRSGAGPVSTTSSGAVYVCGTANMSMMFGNHHFQLSTVSGMFVAKLFVQPPKGENPNNIVRQGTAVDAPLIYPNPASVVLKMELPKLNFERLEIIDVQGRVWVKANVTQRHQQIDLPDIPAGTYFIRFIGQEGTSSYPVVINQAR